MEAQHEWSCWEITKCGNQKNCLATENGNGRKHCWEVAESLDDFRSGLNVCKDCIVYVSKQASPNLTDEELQNIVQQKVDCVLANKCPNYHS